MANALSRYSRPAAAVNTKSDNWDNHDVWSVIAQSLTGKAMMNMACTNKWFNYIMRRDGYLWKRACLRDLEIPEPNIPYDWFKLYTHVLGKHGSLTYPGPPGPIEMRRIGVILFSSSNALLVHDLEASRRSTTNNTLEALLRDANSFVLRTIKTGLWIVDWKLSRDMDDGKIIIALDAQHAETFMNELLLKEDQSEVAESSQPQYANVFTRYTGERVEDTSSAIFDMEHLQDEISDFFKTESWVVCEPFKSSVVDHLLPTWRKTLHAAAMNCTLDAGEGINFSYMDKRAKTGEAVKIRLITVTR